jgi:adenylate kinase
VLNEVNKNGVDNSFLFDGYPRTIKQGHSLDEMVNISKAIWLTVSEKTTIKRNLERGKTSNRPDDRNVEVIENRIKAYTKTSLPLKDFYIKKIIEIDGEGTPDEVYRSVKLKLNQ